MFNPRDLLSLCMAGYSHLEGRAAHSGLAASALQEKFDLHRHHTACNSHVKGTAALSNIANSVLQETDPGRHGLVHDHGRPFTSINSLRPAVLKVCQQSEPAPYQP